MSGCFFLKHGVLAPYRSPWPRRKFRVRAVNHLDQPASIALTTLLLLFADFSYVNEADIFVTLLKFTSTYATFSTHGQAGDTKTNTATEAAERRYKHSYFELLFIVHSV